MVNKENIKKWIKSLRSGKYQQARGVLHIRKSETDQYCCLGVACKIAMDNGVELETYEGQEYPGRVVYYDGAKTHLPPSVRDWLGIESVAPRAFVSAIGDKKDYLSNLNDDGRQFPEIADLIEREYLKESDGIGA